MSTFESIFRYSLKRDFSTTPEQIEQKVERMFNYGPKMAGGAFTGCSSKQIDNSFFNLTLSKFLSRFQGRIIAAGKNVGVNARTIAAVVSWEYLENKKGRYSDYIQGRFPGSTSGIGWGSMHTQEAQRLTKETLTNRELSCIRLDGETAIPLIAKFLKDASDTYFKESNGIYIGNDIALMAYFYNTGLSKATKSAQNRKLVNPTMTTFDQSFTVQLEVSKNDMAVWVAQKVNSGYFKVFDTGDVPPDLIGANGISGLIK